jgi:two-component system LytT family response regulator
MNTNLIQTVIIEDEPKALELLSGLIEATGMAEVVAATTDPFQATDLLIRHEPDMVFLDIRMPGMSGFDILNELKNLNTVMPHVVFTTAHDEYAIKAFDYAAFDYLLKPIDPDRLLETLTRFSSNNRKDAPERTQALIENNKILIFRGVTGVTFIDTDDVICITADGNYSIFHFITGRVETVTSLIGTVEMLLGRHFFRTGRSCIINTAFLVRIDMKQLQCVLIKGEKEFRCDISREKVRQLMEHVKGRITES